MKTGALVSRWLAIFCILALIGRFSEAVSAADITWNNAVPGNAWDLTSANWLTADNNPTTFQQNDNVTFTGAGRTISITSAVSPGSTTVTGTNYLFSGAAISSGPLGIGGSGSLILANDNTFSSVNVASGGTLQIGNGGTTGRIGSTTAPANIVNNGTLVARRSDTLTLRGIMTGSGNLLVASGGLSILSDNSGFSGSTLIRAGTINWNGNQSLGTGTITLNDASTGSSNTSLFRNANGTLSNSIVVANAGTGTSTIGRTTSGATSVIYEGSVLLNRSAVFSSGTEPPAGGIVRFSGPISGTGGITISGNNTVELTGNNTFSGTTTMSGGALAIGNVNALQNSTLNTGTSGSTQVNLVVAGTQTYQLGGLQGSNSLTLGANRLAVGSNNQSTQFAGVLSGSGGLTKNGVGTLTLTGANAFGGTTIINSGTLQLGNGGTTGSLGTGSITNNGNLTINRSNTLSVANTISGTGSVTLSGPGTVILTGANTYAGGTNVTAGTLVINNSSGSGTGTGGLSVSSGATLSGTGTIAGNAVIAGHHSPGNSPGIQTFGSALDYVAGSSIAWELIANSTSARGTGFDGINVGGDLEFSGAVSLALSFDSSGSTVDWTNAFWGTNQTGTSGWLIYLVDGTTSGFANLSITSDNWLDSSGQNFSTVRSGSFFSLYQDGENIYLNYTIPEPGSALLLILGLATLMLRRRMRSAA